MKYAQLYDHWPPSPTPPTPTPEAGAAWSAQQLDEPR